MEEVISRRKSDPPGAVASLERASNEKVEDKRAAPQARPPSTSAALQDAPDRDDPTTVTEKNDECGSHKGEMEVATGSGPLAGSFGKRKRENKSAVDAAKRNVPLVSGQKLEFPITNISAFAIYMNKDVFSGRVLPLLGLERPTTEAIR